MKTLIVCYSLTGKTKQLCTVMKRNLGASISFVAEAKPRSLFSAYAFGALAARTRKAALIKPLDVDISEYNQIIVASPIWAGFPAPAINDFLRQYDLEGKRIYGFLTYSGNPGGADKALEEDITASGAKFKDILMLKTSRENIRAIRGGRLQFGFDEAGLLQLVKGTTE